MLIAEIVPVRRLPANLIKFDYLVPKEMENTVAVGQLTYIPFQKTEIFGSITAIKKEDSKIKNLKSISKLVFEVPVLSAKQINFLTELAELYKTPLSFLIKTNLPPLQKRKLTKLEIKPPTPSALAQHSLKPELVLYHDQTQRARWAEDFIKTPGIKLILVPELNQLAHWAKLLGEDQVIIVNSELTEKKQFEVWWQVYHQEKKIVIGTRAALFLPWNNLDAIVLDDEGNPNYKSWDMAPRFHTRDAAFILAKAMSAKVYLLSHTPSVDSHYFAEKKIYQRQGEWRLTARPETVIVDLKDERRGGNYDVLSQPLVNIAKQAQGDWFFYINRRGQSNYVGCRDCGYVAKCKVCGRGLIFHADSQKLHCHFCKTTFPQSTHCPQCQGVNMVMYGAGTELVENKLRTMFKDRPIVRLDADTADYTKLSDDATSKIIVGTQLAWNRINWSRLGLLAIVDADLTLFVPEFKITENLFQLIRSAEFDLPIEAKLVIQTSHPENAVFKALNNPTEFYETELKNRHDLQYPPFYYLVRIYWSGNTATATSAQAEKMIAQANKLTSIDKRVIIFGPLEMTPYWQNKKFWQTLIVKLPLERYKELTKKLAEIMPADCKFDPNPNTLLTIG